MVVSAKMILKVVYMVKNQDRKQNDHLGAMTVQIIYLDCILIILVYDRILDMPDIIQPPSQGHTSTVR